MFPYFLTNLLIITSKSCPRGQRVTPDGKSCVDRNECLDNPCRNNGQCINRDTVERYTCLCPTGFSGNNCELMQEEQILRLSMGALAIILLCLLSILSKWNSIQKQINCMMISDYLFTFFYICLHWLTFVYICKVFFFILLTYFTSFYLLLYYC